MSSNVLRRSATGVVMSNSSGNQRCTGARVDKTYLHNVRTAINVMLGEADLRVGTHYRVHGS